MGPRGGGGHSFLPAIAGLFGMLLFLAILAGLAALAWKLAKKKGWISKGAHAPGHEPGAPQPHQWSTSDAQRILDKRLAKGEIEVEDYKIRRDVLSGNSYPPFHQPPQPGPDRQPGPEGSSPTPWPTPPVGNHPTPQPHPSPGEPDETPPPTPPVGDHPTAPPHPTSEEPRP